MLHANHLPWQPPKEYMSQFCIGGSQDCRQYGLPLTLTFQYMEARSAQAKGRTTKCKSTSETYPGANCMKRLFQTFCHCARAVGAGCRVIFLSTPDLILTKVAPTKSRPFFERAGFIILTRIRDCRMPIGRSFRFQKREVFPLPMTGHPDLAMTMIPLFFEDQASPRHS